MKFGGEQEETMTSMIGFLLAFIIALIAVYFILVVVFDSYFQPVLVMSIVPFAIVGVLLTLFIHGMPISLLALIGIIGLVGVVVNDTIVMISHLNKKIKSGGKKLEVVAEGAKERFRPVILTTLTTFAGLLPTAYGLGGDIPTMRPMVLVMAWGLIFATFITLGFTPLLYSLFKVRKKQ
jgi:multidrug efflux pump subunit AcrB